MCHPQTPCNNLTWIMVSIGRCYLGVLKGSEIGEFSELCAKFLGLISMFWVIPYSHLVTFLVLIHRTLLLLDILILYTLALYFFMVLTRRICATTRSFLNLWSLFISFILTTLMFGLKDGTEGRNSKPVTLREPCVILHKHMIPLPQMWSSQMLWVLAYHSLWSSSSYHPCTCI